jgi:broad specificity phosphatase PhoE
LPAAKAKATGADLKNPGRFKDRKAQKNARPIGEPYAKMTVREKAAWKELRNEMPWLNAAHRPLVRMACIWIAKMDTKDFGVSATQALSSILSKLGATPVDETKVAHGGDGDEDQEDALFSRNRPRPN